MIFLGVKNKTEKTLVDNIHYAPFDTVHGIRNKDGNLISKQELSEKGILVEYLEHAENRPGFIPILYANYFNKTYWYEYEKILYDFLPIEEKIQVIKQENKELKLQTQDLQIALAELLGVE